MSAIDIEQALGRCLLWRAARDAENRFAATFSGFLFSHLTLDQEDLTDVGKVEIIVEGRARPDAPCLDAPVCKRCRLGELGRTAPFEQLCDVAFERGLIAFDREVVVRLTRDEVLSQRALCQKRIGRDVPARNIAARK